MQRPVQVFLDESDAERLAAWSRKRGWTKSDAIRAAVRALVRPPDEEPLLAASGIILGLPDDVSSQFDRYIEETFVAKASPRRRRPSRPRIRR